LSLRSAPRSIIFAPFRRPVARGRHPDEGPLGRQYRNCSTGFYFRQRNCSRYVLIPRVANPTLACWELSWTLAMGTACLINIFSCDCGRQSGVWRLSKVSVIVRAMMGQARNDDVGETRQRSRQNWPAILCNVYRVPVTTLCPVRYATMRATRRQCAGVRPAWVVPRPHDEWGCRGHRSRLLRRPLLARCAWGTGNLLSAAGFERQSDHGRL
jgi:hypothetical protein